MSAADSRLVFNRRRPIPSDCTNCDKTDSGFLMSGPDCRIRSRRRRIAFSRRSSRGFAYVEGRVRDRHMSPSSLSNSSCCDDMPMNPSSSASVSIDSMRACSDGDGRTSLRVARSKPIVAARMSEWPMKAAMLGPRFCRSSAATYSLGLLQERASSSFSMTCAGGLPRRDRRGRRRRRRRDTRSTASTTPT